MRLLLAGVMLVAIGSCEQARQPSPPPATLDPSAAASHALAAVWASVDGSVLLDAFPRKAGTEACVINIGPPPGRDVAATCSTAVQRHGPDWLVTLIEVWDARSFRKEGSTTTGQQTHTWQFTVNAEGQITHRLSFGEFPPQGVI